MPSFKKYRNFIGILWKYFIKFQYFLRMASLNSHSFCSSVPFYHIHIYMTMKIFSCYEFNFAQNWLPNSPTSENDFQNLFRELHTLLTFSRWTLGNLGRHLIFVTFSTKSKHVRWYESFIVYCTYIVCRRAAPKTSSKSWRMR